MKRHKMSSQMKIFANYGEMNRIKKWLEIAKFIGNISHRGDDNDAGCNWSDAC